MLDNTSGVKTELSHAGRAALDSPCAAHRLRLGDTEMEARL